MRVASKPQPSREGVKVLRGGRGREQITEIGNWSETREERQSWLGQVGKNMVTIKDVEERQKHLSLIGNDRTDPDFGPDMILWTKDREGEEHWEVLPEWIAQLVLNELPYQVERAILYQKPPALAPLSVVSEWVQQRLERGE